MDLGGRSPQLDVFANRREAGLALARRLRHLAGRGDVVVLALPRGGVPVGFEVAKALGARLDVFVVRKLGLPGYPELAMGAIASGDTRVLNEDVVHWYRPSPQAVDAVTRNERLELERRERNYRGSRPLTPIEGHVVILVDDGLATGSTMRAAILAVRRLKPVRVQGNVRHTARRVPSPRSARRWSPSLVRDVGTLNLFRRVPSLQMPVFFFVGRRDRWIPPDTSVAYFNSLQAPSKQLVWFEESAHEPFVDEPAKFNRTMIELVRPSVDVAIKRHVSRAGEY